ncbi:suppressor of fused domain protein [Flavonifractor sp. An82]|uniref:suppressor of fused domain protein n=1 Tax=Flavonifractor sp. An82 TaxID=1965660 RepID=UPI001FA880D0|nr:suppressor of fused domain protein [Flavonifractor sp. An82]
MELLEQCQLWHQNNEYQRIIDALEAIPAETRTPEMDSELARAYNNIAGLEDKALFQKALDLLKPHEDYFQGDHFWNFRIAYAYYYLDQEGLALRYFQRALEARPGDGDTMELIESCRKCLTLPRFEASFRERTRQAWQAFEAGERELRRIMDEDVGHQRGQEVIARCEEILHLALADVSFELGFNGTKYELILSPEGDRLKLFELVYFQHRAPTGVLEHWDIMVGRQPTPGCSLHTGGWEVSGDDVQVWPERLEGDRVGLTLYCEKLLPLLRDEEDRAWWMLFTLTDQALGEIPHMRYVERFQVTDTPPEGSSIPLSRLSDALEDMGLCLSTDALGYLESYTTYQMEPEQDRDADWRLDICVGSTCCTPLINDYLSGESDGMDELHQNGAVAGFFCYPLEGFTGEDRSQQLFAFRDALEEALTTQAGEDALTLTGGATGLYCGYVDFIAWDLDAVLSAAADFFQSTSLPWASFHTFRRDVGTVRLVSRDVDPDQVHPETGSLLSPEDIAALESFSGDSRGYFGRMLDFLQNFMDAGVEEGRFTRGQARRDLQIALWYAYACNNMDEYRFYYQAAQWMPDSEENAKGCGTWYYRYSAALMYCGRLEEAQKYAELGAQEEPDYPWIWLQVAKLRSHFGDQEGALDAVQQGLALEPGDYEFLTLRGEILAGASLEQMEYHWINPDLDRALQDGADEGAAEKLCSIACITTDPNGLASFHQIFSPDPEDFETDAPYCAFHYPLQGHQLEVVFRMNQAGLSKRKPQWLATQKARMDSGSWLTWTTPQGEHCTLETVLFDLDDQVTLLYTHTAGKRKRYFYVRLEKDGTPGDWEEVDTSTTSAGKHYSEAEMEAVENHIQRYFGPFENVWHELESPDIHVDICLIPPGEDRDYYTLVTMGMGAHRMNVPQELAEHRLERAELAIALPPDWKLEQEALSDENWYWPVRLLKILARLPISTDSWLAWGHTVDNQEPFADGTQLSASILISPQRVEEEGFVCTLPGGEEVNFYQVIPLYDDELQYKLSHDADELLERMEGLSFVVSPDRPHATDATARPDDDGLLDDGAWHLQSIRDKHLPVDELAAYRHMAVYLRWCMEHDLMSLAFLEQYGSLVQRFQSDFSHLDLSVLIRDELDGTLPLSLFDQEGQAFARFYYGGEGDCSYPDDVDAYALRYFGPERCSGEFQDEAYLFLPADEACYQALAAIIQQRWDRWNEA